MRRPFAPLALILLGWLAVAGVFYAEPAKAVSGDTETQVSRFVSGILGYARWPKLGETYRFCLAGEIRHLNNAPNSLLDVARPVSVRSLAADETGWAAQCDVLYIGAMTPAQRGRLLAEAIGMPVLT
ncbi:MAG: YfiR family protein, partial [Azonexus sp.]|nr:YfiR family protein [Azonexus sp.]